MASPILNETRYENIEQSVQENRCCKYCNTPTRYMCHFEAHESSLSVC